MAITKKQMSFLAERIVGKTIHTREQLWFHPEKDPISAESTGEILSIDFAPNGKKVKSIGDAIAEVVIRGEEDFKLNIPFKHLGIFDVPDLSSHQVHSYNYTPSRFNKHGQSDSNRFYGVEIEMDEGGNNNTNASLVLSNDPNEEFHYIMHDGSLSNGFELVTHPATINALANSQLKETLEMASILGYKGDVDTCGLHIHIDRNAFNNSNGKSLNNIGKLIYLFEKFWAQFVAISRRKESNLQRYAKRYTYKYNPIDSLSFDEILEMNTESLTRESCDHKYFSINLKHDATVELRIFKGTSCYSSIIGLVQFVDQLVNVCVDIKMDDIRKVTFWDIIEPIMDKVEFRGYIANIVEKGYLNFDEELKGLIEARLAN